MFSFVPTTKPANDNHSTFLGVFGFYVVFECLRFFLSISYHTGSLWLSSFRILAAFFLPNEIFIIIFDFVAVVSRINGFKSLQKLKLELKVRQHTFLLNICKCSLSKKTFGHQNIIWYIQNITSRLSAIPCEIPGNYPINLLDSSISCDSTINITIGYSNA